MSDDFTPAPPLPPLRVIAKSYRSARETCAETSAKIDMFCVETTLRSWHRQAEQSQRIAAGILRNFLPPQYRART